MGLAEPTALAIGEDHPDRWPVLGVCCLGLFLLVTSLSSLNVALPSIQRDLGASAAELQWIIDSYAVVFGGLLLTGGAIGDRIGRKTALTLGFGLLLTGGALGGLASSVEAVLTARAVGGLGAALMMPATLSILGEVFAPAGRRQAIAIWSGVAGGGAAFGPLVGGWLLTVSGWPAVFWMVAILAAGGLLGVLAVVPNLRPASRSPLDLVGAVLSTAAIGLALWAIIAAPDGATEPATALAALGAIAATAAFIVWERRTPSPMLPLRLFRRPRVRAGVGTLLLGAIGFAGVIFVTAIWLQVGWGETALVTGILLVPIGAAELAVSSQSPRAAKRFGTNTTIVVGLACMAVGYIGLAVTPIGVREWIIVAGILAGVGNGLVIPLSVDRVVAQAEPELAGVTAGVNETAIELGASVGIALLGALQRVVFQWQLPDGAEGDALLIFTGSVDPAIVEAFQVGSRAALVAAALAACLAIPVALLGPEDSAETVIISPI